VERSAAALAALVKGVQGRVTAWEGTQDASGNSVAIQLFVVSLAAKDALAAQFKAIGKVRGQKATQNPQAPDGKLATAHLNVRLTNVTPIVASDDGLWPQIRRSLSYAFTLLSVSLMFLIVGVSVLLPWAVIGSASRSCAACGTRDRQRRDSIVYSQIKISTHNYCGAANAHAKAKKPAAISKRTTCPAVQGCSTDSLGFFGL
jgi:hypothetical protein